MGIISKTVKVFPRGSSIAHYREKGYDAKYGQELEVKVEDLTPSSAALIITSCDYCGKEKEPIRYADYNAQTKNGTEKCCCLDCAHLKREEVMLKKYGHRYAMEVPELKEKLLMANQKKYGSNSPSSNPEVRQKQKETLLKNYGVENPSLSKELQEKRKQTFMDRYGVENPFLSSEIQEKIKKTNLERYGAENVFYNKAIQNKKNAILIKKYGTSHPLQNPKCLKKMKKTVMKKYGVEHVSQLEDTKQKVKNTNLKNCGYESHMKSPEFLEKWFTKNGSNFVKSSRQQKYLCNLYKGILNYPFRCFALDVYLPEDKIDVEFDGSGHRMSISLGNVTEEEFEKRELYRNVSLKREGYKQMRIISDKDLLPSDNILLEMLNTAKQYFSDYPNHSWYEFNISASTMRNAENKQGVPYDFGTLRRIKDSDLSSDLSTINTTQAV